MTDEELEELKLDLAERKARRERGEEPATWQPPEREPAQPSPLINVGKLMDAFHAHVEERILNTADILGEEMGRNEKAMRAAFEDTITRAIAETRAYVSTAVDELRTEFVNHARVATNKLLTIREQRESATTELEEKIFNLRREIDALRNGRAASLNGGGVHADH